MAVRLVVSGASGRMGGLLGRLAADAPDFELTGGIASDPAPEASPYPAILPLDEAGPLIAGCDVLVDFSAPSHLGALLDQHAQVLRGRAVVIGTTGLDATLDAAVAAAAQGSPVLVAPNFSIGVNLLLELARQAARVLGGDGFDVEIVEAHHRHKVDAPSGTALALGEAIAAARDVDLNGVRRDGRGDDGGGPRTGGERPRGEIAFHALRGGEIVGEHEVRFIGANEQVSLAHVARDRTLFAEGALRAARWMAGRAPGRYTMRDVLGLGD